MDVDSAPIAGGSQIAPPPAVLIPGRNGVGATEGSDPTEGLTEWAHGVERRLARRFAAKLAAAPDGTPVVATPPTRRNAPDADWSALMIIDCGYETLTRRPERLGSSHSERSDVDLWLMGRDEWGRSACLWIRRPVPYFYVGISDPDPVQAERNAQLYAQSLAGYLQERIEASDRGRSRHSQQDPQASEGPKSSTPRLLYVRPVKRRWFYGFRPDPAHDGGTLRYDPTLPGAVPPQESPEAAKRRAEWIAKQQCATESLAQLEDMMETGGFVHAAHQFGALTHLEEDSDAERVEKYRRRFEDILIEARAALQQLDADRAALTTVPWDGSTTQASDWYLRVACGTPFHVTTLRQWAAEWVRKMAEPYGGCGWRPPQVRTTSTVRAPVDLTIFEGNAEFSLRQMIDRGLVGCGWVAIDTTRTQVPADRRTTRCDLEYEVDGDLFERAELTRDRALEIGHDPWPEVARELECASVRFVAREAALQRGTDGWDREAFLTEYAEQTKYGQALLEATMRDREAELVDFTSCSDHAYLIQDGAEGREIETHAEDLQQEQIATLKEVKRRSLEAGVLYIRQMVETHKSDLVKPVERVHAVERWFEDLRQAAAPLSVMAFDIECCNRRKTFAQPDQDDGFVVTIAMRLYRIDRVEAYERMEASEERRGVLRDLQAARTDLERLNTQGITDAEFVDDLENTNYQKEVSKCIEFECPRCGDGFFRCHCPAACAHSQDREDRYDQSRTEYDEILERYRAQVTERLRKRAEDTIVTSIQRLATIDAAMEGLCLVDGGKSLSGTVEMDTTQCRWSPPLHSVVMGLGSRDPLTEGGANGYPVDSYGFADEREMLTAMARLVRVWDPDLLLGYNSVAYDTAYLLRRALHLGIDREFMDLGRLPGRLSRPKEEEFGNKAKGKRSEWRATIPGRLQFDIYRACEADPLYNPRSYRLDDVARDLLGPGEGKTGLKYSEIPIKHWGSDADRRELDEYCDNDAVLPFKIERHQSYLMRYIELARVTGVPFNFLVTKGQQVLVFAQILRRARQEAFAIPYLPVAEPEQSITEARKNKAYQGAVVISPRVGFYTAHRDGPVPVLDYNSLYPSTMMFKNLDYTTLVTDPKAAEALRAQHRALAAAEDAAARVEDPWFEGDLLSRPFEIAAGAEVAPVRAADGYPDPVFVRATIRRGMLSDIIQALLDARGRAKAAMNQHPKGSAAYKVQDARQLALKVCCNSLYGFTGAPVGRQPCLPIAASTTGYSRVALYFAKRLAEQLLRGDNEVLYGDTDSIMVLMKDLATGERQRPGEPLSPLAMRAIAEAFVRGRELAAEINARLKGGLRIVLEKVYSPFLILKPKKYATLMWMRPEAPHGTDAKGIEMVRRDNPHVTSMAQAMFVELLMGKGPRDPISGELQALVPDQVTGIAFLSAVHRQILRDQLPTESYITTGKYGKPAHEYKNRQPHVELALRMQQRDPGSAPHLGSRVPYVIVREGPGYGPKQYERAEDPDWAREHGLPVDTAYVAAHKFEPPALRLLAPVLARDLLASAPPPDPGVYRRQRERYRNQPAKLEEWLEAKRQEVAEKRVFDQVFRENYHGRKVRKLRHDDSPLFRFYPHHNINTSSQHPAGAIGPNADPVGGQAPPPPLGPVVWDRQTRGGLGGPDDEDDSDEDALGPDAGVSAPDEEDARARVQAVLCTIMSQVRAEIDARRGEEEEELDSTSSSPSPAKRPRLHPPRGRHHQQRQGLMTAFFQPKSAATVVSTDPSPPLLRRKNIP